MKLHLKYGIPFIEIILENNNKQVILKNVLVDTGSASTIISTEIALQLDLEANLTDALQRVRGVGGYEFVYEKVIDIIKIGNSHIEGLRIQVGAMDYGFEINAILGMDFLSQGKLTIDCGKLELHSGE